MTYSIIGRDPREGLVGVAVQSHYFGVGRLVTWAQPGVGAVATQSVVDPQYGAKGLELMAAGMSPTDALGRIGKGDPGFERRQVAMMDTHGATVQHTGSMCIGNAGEAASENSCAQANLVVGPDVWHSMPAAFEESPGDLARRLLHSLRAAQEAGGDLRGQQAAAIVVVREEPTGDLNHDLVVDVRVDDSTDPLGDLEQLLGTGEAMSGLLRLLTEPGLLTGPFTASQDEVASALEELRDAQARLGATNREPSVWSGLLLARAGRLQEARENLAYAYETVEYLPILMRELAKADMWDRPISELEQLLSRLNTDSAT